VLEGELQDELVGWGCCIVVCVSAFYLCVSFFFHF